MSVRNKTLFLHLVGSISFLLLPIIFNPGFTNLKQLLGASLFWSEQLYFILLLGYFYLNYYVLIPAVLYNKKYLLFFIYTVFLYVCIAFISTVPIEIMGNSTQLNPLHANRPPPFRQVNGIIFREFNQHLFKFLVVLISAVLIRNNHKLKRLEKEKLQAELSFLKAQIKPHFLFNTLNSIYSLAIQKSNEVPHAIALFSVMLRYITNEAHKNFIPINKELGYISSYVGLQKLRFENTVNVEFFIEGSTDEREIAPLILSTFVENAFKYGVNPEKKSVIKISVFLSETELCLTVFNFKVIEKISPENQSGLGLENVKMRLQLLYPNLHELSINNEEESYSILLKIKLQ